MLPEDEIYINLTSGETDIYVTRLKVFRERNFTVYYSAEGDLYKKYISVSVMVVKKFLRRVN